jgi:hypothetical protein
MEGYIVSIIRFIPNFSFLDGRKPWNRKEYSMNRTGMSIPDSFFHIFPICVTHS